MASKINKLSGVVLSRLIKPGLYGDGGGLWLQVSTATARSWVFRYTIRGRRHQMGLGSTDTIDLATARLKARFCRQLMLDGKDPLHERRAAVSASSLVCSCPRVKSAENGHKRSYDITQANRSKQLVETGMWQSPLFSLWCFIGFGALLT